MQWFARKRPVAIRLVSTALVSLQNSGAAFAIPKSMIRGAGRPSSSATTIFGRLQVAVNNRLLMRMLHSVTHEVEEFQTFPDTQSLRSAGHGSIVLSQRYVHPAQARPDAAIALLE